MLRGRFSGENDDKNDNSPPDRLIHFEPEEGSSESNQENGSVFGTYYKNIASDESESDGKLFGKKPSDNFGNPNLDTEESSTDDVEHSSAVTFQPDDVIDEDLSESSFPLFLSFKANDPAKSISEAIREKSNLSDDKIDETIDFVQDKDIIVKSDDTLTNDILSDDFIESSNDPFDIPLDELDVPIFKPIETTQVEKNTTSYDIPKVFENDSAPIQPSEEIVSDSNVPGNLFFPLSDVSDESELEIESDPFEGTVLPETPTDVQGDNNKANNIGLVGKSSGFAFLSDISDTPEMPDSVPASIIQAEAQPIVEPSPVIDDAVVSESASQKLSEDLNESAPIFAPLSASLISNADDKTDQISNEEDSLLIKDSTLSDSVSPEDTSIAIDNANSITAPSFVKTRGPSTRVRSESVAAVLKDDGFAVFKEVNISDNDSVKSAEGSNSILTERPGRNYSSKQVSSTVSPSQKGIQSSVNLDRSTNKYTAAQQMGTVAPQPQRYHKKKNRSAAPYVPLIAVIIAIILFIGLWQAWKYFDLGNVFSKLFGSSSDPKVSTFQTPSTASSITSDTPASSETTSEPTPTPTTTPTPSPTPTTKPTETTPTTTVTTTIIHGDPTKFVTKILNGSSDGATAYFDIRFENSGSNDSSLVDSLKQITITYESSKTIEEVTSSYFTFVKKEGSTNVFVGTPTSTDIILREDFVLVDITGVTAGSNVGSFSIKYFIEYNS